MHERASTYSRATTTSLGSPGSSVRAAATSVAPSVKTRARRQALARSAAKYQVAESIYTGDYHDKQREEERAMAAAAAAAMAAAVTRRQAKDFDEALRRREFQTVLWMIENGDVPIDYEAVNGENALLAAVAAKSFDTVRILMKRGLSINSGNRRGYTALIKAIAAASPLSETSAVAITNSAKRRKGRKAGVAKLEALYSTHTGSGSDFSTGNNNNNNNGEESAGQARSPDLFDNEMLQFVLQFDPDLFQRDAYGKTAFDWAKRTGNVRALEMLEVKKGEKHMHMQQANLREKRIAECVALTTQHDEIAATMACFLRQPLYQAEKFLRFLQQITITIENFDEAISDLQEMKGPMPTVTKYFVNRETSDGWTPLTKAAANGDVDSLILLLAMGAEMEHETRLRHTAMTWACYCGHEAVCLQLLRLGVRIDQRTQEGKTALIHAICNSQVQIVHHLLNYLHDQAIPTQAKEAFVEDTTALLRRKATMARRHGIVENVLEWHDQFLQTVGVRDRAGKTALQYAEEMHAATSMKTEQDRENEAKVLQKLHNMLVQAREHQQYVKANFDRTKQVMCRFEGCGYRTAKDQMPRHEQILCTKRIVPCDQCGADVTFEGKEVHEVNQCLRRSVPCVHADRGCRELLIYCDRESHEVDHCRKRPVECRLECGKGMSYDERDAHETQHCPLRTIECPEHCGSAMLAKDYKTHRRKECPKRLLPCFGSNTGSGGCGMSVAADVMEFHVNQLCEKRRMPCKWARYGCPEAIGGSAGSRHYHEDHECNYRLVDCRNACSASGHLLFCFLEEHYAWQCVKEPRECASGCGAAPLIAHELHVHVLSDAGDCAKRTTRCRLDLCGKKLKLYDPDQSKPLTSDVSIGASLDRPVSLRALEARAGMSAAFLASLHAWQDPAPLSLLDPEQKQPRPLYATSSSLAYLIKWMTVTHTALERELESLRSQKEAHARMCRVLTFSPEQQHHLIEFSDGRSEWMSLAGHEYEVIIPSNAEQATVFRCGAIMGGQQRQHEDHECALRLIACPLACGQRLSAMSIGVHLAKRCNLRNEKCRLGCGAIMPFLQLSEHEDRTCELREVFCEHCHEAMRARLLATHLDRNCQHLPRRCRLGCAAKVAMIDFEKHESTTCPKRLVPCKQCAKPIWVSEQTVHDADECPLRVFGPCESQCGEVLLYNQVTHHLLHECSQRTVVCRQCDARVQAKQLESHKTLLCPQRYVYCRKGCGVQLKDINSEAHEEEECTRRVLTCPNQCGEQCAYFQMQTHLQLTCSMRVMACPHGCGDKLFAYQYETHWKRCRQRVSECGAGSKKCARPIRLWFANRRLVKCALHGETGLLWALKCQDEELVSYLLHNVESDQVNVEFANGFTPLTIAAALPNEALVKALLRFGADVNLETTRGRTPLAEACMSLDEGVVQLLVDNRAQVTHTNRHGRNLLALARSFAAASTGEAAVKAKRVLEILEDRSELEKQQRELFVAISTSNYDLIATYLKYCSVGQFEDHQDDQLMAVLETKAEQHAQAQKELDESIRAFNESVADTEAKATAVLHLSEHVDHCETQIAKVDTVHDESLAESNALEADMHAFTREITAHDIARLVNAHVPPEEYLVVMKAICMLCGVTPRGRRVATEYTDMEWWKAAQALLMDRTLLQRLRGYRNTVILPEMMNKVRRECIKHPSFVTATRAFTDAQAKFLAAVAEEEAAKAALIAKEAQAGRLKIDIKAKANGTVNASPSGNASAGASAGSTEEEQLAVSRRMSRLPPVEDMNGDIVAILATWVKGVEIEYKASAERHALGERKRRLAVSLATGQEELQQATFDMQVAQRSLPARQEEVDAARAQAEAATRELVGARQRIKVRHLLNFSALSGHTPLSFACAVGNEAMVNMLLTHGASCSYAEEERMLCASFIQLMFRDFVFKQTTLRRNLEGVRSRSDAAVEALVRNVAHTFLVSHFVRKIRMFRQTHRVPLHEALANGFHQIAAILLDSGAVLWQRTHVLPQRVFPGSVPPVDYTANPDIQRLGRWQLTPLGNAPMTVRDTLAMFAARYDSRTFRRETGWDANQSRYEEVQAFMEEQLKVYENKRAALLRDVLAQKNVARKTAELKAMHERLERAIVAQDFRVASQLMDDGAFADFETPHDGLTALGAACIDELYVENADGLDVLAVEFLLDREKNRPYVNGETSTGWTPLARAMHHGTLKCAQALLERGANVNQASRKTGRTALMAAARNGQTSAIEFLLRLPEVDVLLRDKDGCTAYDHARARRFDDAMHVLGAAMGGNRGRVFSSLSASFGVCKWGCGYMIEMAGHVVLQSQVIKDTHPLQEHEAHTCPKRLVSCPNECGVRDLWFESLPEHVAHQCVMRLVPCAQPKCGAQCAFQHMPVHERDECELRTIHCACGESMTFQKHVLHARNQCPLRLVPCPANCTPDGLYRAMDLRAHQRSDCELRVVRCRNGCPIDDLLAKDRPRHETAACPMRRVACKWGCHDAVLASTQYHHEHGLCARRQLPCPNRCGEQAIVFEDLEHHTTKVCPRRLVLCRAGCGRKVPMDSMATHQQNDCRKRRVTCPLCHDTNVIDDELATHMSATCTHRISVCGLCGQTNVPYSKLAFHRENECKMRPVTCQYKCFVKLLLAHEKEKHETFECAFRPIHCPLGCGDVIIANTLKRHERVCLMRFVHCTHGCGFEGREKDRREHELLYCPANKGGHHRSTTKDKG